MDRWIHPSLAVHLPADVDHQSRVRRIWPTNRPPKMLLIVSLETHSSERLVSEFPFDVVTNLKNNLAMSMPEPETGMKLSSYLHKHT